jgi:hypothetical protein
MPLKSDLHSTALLKMLFWNEVAAANVYNQLGSGQPIRGTAGSMYVALHTADPGKAGLQDASEVTVGAFAGYARQPVLCDPSTWTFTTPKKMSNTATITFGPKTNGGTVTVLYASVGVAMSGATKLLYRAPLALTQSATFQVNAGNLIEVANQATTINVALNDQVMFIDVESDVLPTEINTNLVYYVIGSPGTHSFTISDSLGGGTKTVTAGSGRIAKVLSKTITLNDRFEFAATKLEFTED